MEARRHKKNFFKNENVAPALASLIFFAALALCALFLLKATYIRVQVRRQAGENSQ